MLCRHQLIKPQTAPGSQESLYNHFMEQWNGLYKVTQNHSNHSSMVIRTECLLCPMSPGVLFFIWVSCDWSSKDQSTSCRVYASWILFRTVLCHLQDDWLYLIQHKVFWEQREDPALMKQKVYNQCALQIKNLINIFYWALQSKDSENSNAMSELDPQTLKSMETLILRYGAQTS